MNVEQKSKIYLVKEKKKMKNKKMVKNPLTKEDNGGNIW